uniref:Uncharacterized protein n=1 Tax=Lutzomyia longipalpis TaxID=7200 RepID=A0A1B0CQ17_LUTLO
MTPLAASTGNIERRLAEWSESQEDIQIVPNPSLEATIVHQGTTKEQSRLIDNPCSCLIELNACPIGDFVQESNEAHLVLPQSWRMLKTANVDDLHGLPAQCCKQKSLFQEVASFEHKKPREQAPKKRHTKR